MSEKPYRSRGHPRTHNTEGRSIMIPRGSVLYFMEFIAGMSYSALGSSLPDLSQLLDLTKSEASLFPVVLFTGALFALVLIGSMVPNARVALSGASR